MASISQSWVQPGKPQPVYRVTILVDDGTVNGDFIDLQIKNVEKESNYMFTEISVPDMYGGSQSQGHIFQSKIYAFQNHLEQQMVILKALQGKRVAAALELGWPDEEETALTYREKRRILFGVTPAGNLSTESEFGFKNKLSFGFSIESVPERPRVIISLSGHVDLRPEMFPLDH